MEKPVKGGNSRLLSKQLDQIGDPVAIVDENSRIVFVNAAMCELAAAEATQLVGRQCSWGIAPDNTPHGAILAMLAPPENCRQGAIVTRQLSTPPVFGSSIDGQCFIPLSSAIAGRAPSGASPVGRGPSGGAELPSGAKRGDGAAERSLPPFHITTGLVLVRLGDWRSIRLLTAAGSGGPSLARRDEEKVLATLRLTWQALDGIMPLIGTSPSAQLALARAQLAVDNPCNFICSGPPGSGKGEVVEGIFALRLRRANLPVVAGRLFPIDCDAVDSSLFSGMLELFAGRLLGDVPESSQHLSLQNLEQLDSLGCSTLCAFLMDRRDSFQVSATISDSSPEELAARGADWAQLIARLGELHIHLPSLGDRREDVLVHANQALALYGTLHDRPHLRLARDTAELLTAYNWPGNLRQVREVIESSARLCVLSDSIQANQLPIEVRTFASTAGNDALVPLTPVKLDEILTNLERVMLRRALKASPRNRAQAARLLGISRPRLLRRVEQLGLEDPRDQSYDGEST